MQIPAKLYELVGLGVQTLVVTEEGSAAAMEADRLGVIRREPTDVEGIAAVIRSVAKGELPARLRACDDVYYRNISDRYADILRSISP